MEFNFDSNLKKEILEEALSKLKIEAYRALVLSQNDHGIEDFNYSTFVADPLIATDLAIVAIFDRLNMITEKLEELES